MAGITTGIATTFALPNYHGELFALTPSDDPAPVRLGGLGGGEQTNSTSSSGRPRTCAAAASRPASRVLRADR